MLNYLEAMSNESCNRCFEDKTRDFLSEFVTGKGFHTVYREIGHNVSDLKVGTGRHTGLVYKNGDVTHAQIANNIYDKLLSYFRERSYEPYSYELIKPNFVAVGERKGVVQDYFCEPSLNELHSYYVMIKEMKKMERKLKRPLNIDETQTFRNKFMRDEDSRLRCEQLLNQPHNNNFTLEEMSEVEREFTSDTEYLHLLVKPSNVIVLGQKRKEDKDRIGLVIIDY